MSDLDLFDGALWALVYFHKSVFLAALRDPKTSVVELDVFKQRIIDTFSTRPVRLEVAFEYLNPIVPTEDGRLTRQPIALPYDLTSDPAPVHVVAEAISFIGDMSREDQKAYMGLIRQGFAMATQAKASRAGIVLPGERRGR